jgi:hypothetical protein
VILNPPPVVIWSSFRKTVAALERSDNVATVRPRFRLQLKRGYSIIQTAAMDDIAHWRRVTAVA